MNKFGKLTGIVFLIFAAFMTLEAFCFAAQLFEPVANLPFQLTSLTSVQIADTNNNGHSEIIASTMEGPLGNRTFYIEGHESIGDNSFEEVFKFSSPFPNSTFELELNDVGDADQDGKKEILAVGEAVGGSRLFLYEAATADSYPTTLVWQTTIIPSGVFFNHSAKITDFDQDGKKELTVCTLYDFFIFENTGDNTYEEVFHTEIPAYQYFGATFTGGDFDSDGNIEIIVPKEVLSPDSNGYILYENTGDNTYVDHGYTIIGGMQAIYGISKGYFTRDDAPQLVILGAEAGYGKVWVYELREDNQLVNIWKDYSGSGVGRFPTLYVGNLDQDAQNEILPSNLETVDPPSHNAFDSSFYSKKFYKMAELDFLSRGIGDADDDGRPDIVGIAKEGRDTWVTKVFERTEALFPQTAKGPYILAHQAKAPSLGYDPVAGQIEATFGEEDTLGEWKLMGAGAFQKKVFKREIDREDVGSSSLSIDVNHQNNLLWKNSEDTIFSRKFSRLGEPLTDKFPLFTGSPGARFPLISDIASDSQGNSHAIWSDGDVYYQKIDSAGNPVGAVQMIASGAYAKIKVDGSDNLNIVFCHNGDTFYLKLDNSGRAILGPIDVSNSAIEHDSNPNMDLYGNILHVVWQTQVSDRSDAFYQKVDIEDGSLIGNRAPIISVFPNQLPVVAVNSLGEVYLMVNADVSGTETWQIWYRKVGGSYDGIQLINDRFLESPRIVFDEFGRLNMSWLGWDETAFYHSFVPKE